MNKMVFARDVHVKDTSSHRRNRVCIRKSTFIAYINAEKTFGIINRTYLLYKVRELGISGLLYEVIQTISDSSNSSKQINDMYTSIFCTASGVKQRDPLSPTLVISISITFLHLYVMVKALMQMVNYLMSFVCYLLITWFLYIVLK